jgi:hypothetical protein
MVVSAPAPAQWDHPVIWDQMDGFDTERTASFVEFDGPCDAYSADDFVWQWHEPITDIRFAGWATGGDVFIDKFRVSFYTNVPATVDDDAKPGDLLYEKEFAPVDPDDPMQFGWRAVGDGLYRINLREDEWFFPGYDEIRWICIQGMMLTDGQLDVWYWRIRDRYLEANLGSAAFYSDFCFDCPPWCNWGFEPGYGDGHTYDGPLPDGWTRADAAFALHSIPEPASLWLLSLGFVLIPRR